jgi:hypothetical protein
MLPKRFTVTAVWNAWKKPAVQRTGWRTIWNSNERTCSDFVSEKVNIQLARYTTELKSLRFASCSVYFRSVTLQPGATYLCFCIGSKSSMPAYTQFVLLKIQNRYVVKILKVKNWKCSKGLLNSLEYRFKYLNLGYHDVSCRDFLSGILTYFYENQMLIVHRSSRTNRNINLTLTL